MSRRSAVMSAQYKKAVSTPNEYIKFSMDANEPWVWYLLLSNFDGDNGEFASGEYLVRMEAPPDFPYKPPYFKFLTPNGVYGINTKVCISIGQFHADQYRAALGMAGFANQLVSGMIGWTDLGGGIAILNTTLEDKKKLSAASTKYNVDNHADILKSIEESYITYAVKFTKPIEKREVNM